MFVDLKVLKIAKKYDKIHLLKPCRRFFIDKVTVNLSNLNANYRKDDAKMLKKFKKWRDKLTYKQLEKILVVLGIIVAIVYTASLVLTKSWEDSYWCKDEIPFPLMAFLMLFFLEIAILILIWLLFDGINKSINYNIEQVQRRLGKKFKDGELIEVYFCPEGISEDAKNILSDTYIIYDLKYFAYKENDKVIVILMQDENEVERYPISNWNFFEANFKFVETKEKE